MHLFRCIQCDTLLKLDEDFVNLVYEEEYGEETQEQLDEEQILITGDEEVDYDEEIYEEHYTGPILSVENPMEEGPVELEVIPEKKVRIGGYFGQEITIKPKNNGHDNTLKVIDTVVNVRGESPPVKKPISITSLKPPKRTTIKLCKICGTTITSVQICPNCGARVD
jgi:hypothetical protein